MTKLIGRVGLLLLGLSMQAAGAQSKESLCSQLAAEARRVPTRAWAAERSPLGAVLKIDRRLAGVEPTALEASIARNPEVLEAVSVPPEGFTEVQRLPGTDVYRADSFQGTANCQYSAFLEAKAGAAPRMIESPKSMQGGGAPCWTQRGDFAHVAGQPAYVVQGPVSDHELDEVYTIEPWTGKEWGPSCSATLTFRKKFQLIGQFCANAEACKTGAMLATKIAAVYDAGDFEAGQFRFGPAPSPAILDSVRRLKALPRSEFPTLDGEPRKRDVFLTSYTNDGVETFPLRLNGKWYVAVVGRAGIGWRQSRVTLISVFEDKPGGLVPLAGFQVKLVNGGLDKAAVDVGKRQPQ